MEQKKMENTEKSVRSRRYSQKLKHTFDWILRREEERIRQKYYLKRLWLTFYQN